MKSTLIIIILVAAALGALWYARSEPFALPEGETTGVEEHAERGANESDSSESDAGEPDSSRRPADTDTEPAPQSSKREIMVTDGVKHSISLGEILSGGPGKDGIPSIDEPKFVSEEEAAFLEADDPGIGLTLNGESRFYPYRIMVWHEIANDTVGGEPVLVTYCPLCATGIVFERRVAGEVQEFGVSGRLWQSNLLMYNRAASEEDESLWSQVLGEAVLGVHTGERLRVLRSDVVKWGDWREAHPDTRVLSRDTGASRDYTRDPYGDYYTSDSVSFGASFDDDRLHPKALVHGIEIDGQYKAYHDEALEGTVTDAFAGKEIIITKTDSGELTFTADGEPLSSIPGFWFSWLAVHPETELYK